MNSQEFEADAQKRSRKRIMNWYHDNLLRCLEDAKEKRVRDIDTSIALANQLLATLDEPLKKQKVVPVRNVDLKETFELMRPVEPEIVDILMKATEKGATEAYCKARNKKAPEDKYYFREVTSWYYGWQQKHSRMLGKDLHFNRTALIRNTFYRKNNVGPDPAHYKQPAGGGTISICSNYECKP